MQPTSAAVELRRLLEDSQREITVSVPWLRYMFSQPAEDEDERRLPGRRAPFLSEERRTIEDALEAAGLGVVPTLREASPNGEVMLYLRRPTAEEAVPEAAQAAEAPESPNNRAGQSNRTTRESRLRHAAKATGERVVAKATGKRIKTTWKVVAGVVASLATLATLAGGWELVHTPAPEPLSGDLNIAVGRFSRSGAEGSSPEGETLAESLKNALGRTANSIDEDLDIQVRGPAAVGDVEVPARRSSAPAAAMAAKRHNASVVVYGSFEVTDGGTSFSPTFYVSPGFLVGAEELAGEYPLGEEITVSGDATKNLRSRARLRMELLARTHALAEFVVGLGYYGTNEFGAASRHLRLAESAQGWGAAKPVVLLFLAHSVGKDGRLEAARRYYERALRFNPRYARARYGIAEIAFQEARGGCDGRTVNVGGLRKAERLFQAVRAARPSAGRKSPGLLPAKTSLGLARISLCLSQAGKADEWMLAERRFISVIADYRRFSQLREEASEAHAGLGLIYLPQPREAGATRKFERAAQEYGRAARLSRAPDRQALFHGMLGYIFDRLSRREEARRHYSEAARLEPDARIRATYRLKALGAEGGA